MLLIGSLVVVMRKVMKWYQKWGFVAINLLCGFLEFQDWFVGRMWKSLKQQAREVLRWYTSILILVAQKSLQKRNPLGIGLDARTFVYNSKDCLVREISRHSDCGMVVISFSQLEL